MNIVIVGTGQVGRALAGGWRKAGHQVTFAARDPGKASLTEVKQQGFAVTPIDKATGAAEVVVLAVPWREIEAAVSSLGGLAGKIVVDVTNPVGPGFVLAKGADESVGETTGRAAKGARVVKAFNTTGAGNMADSRYPGGKLMMPIAGDDAEAKRVVATLAADLGFDPVDVGPLTMSRHLEQMALVWIRLALVEKLGPNIGFALLRR